jgi:hypothetical protein
LVVSEYFEGDWIACDASRNPLLMALNLDALYAHLLAPLMPYPARQSESMQAQMERMGKVRSKQRELEKCEIKLRQEKQFNRMIDINSELRNLKQELESLIA